MADKTLSTIIGGSARVVSEMNIWNTVSGSGPGVLFSVTPPSGKRVVLTYLCPLTPGIQSQIEVHFGGRVILDGSRPIANPPDPTTWAIGQSISVDPLNVSGGANAIAELVGDTDETLEIVKASSGGSVTLVASYLITD